MIFTWIGNGEREHAYVRARAYVRFACLHLLLCADRNTTSTYCVPNQLESCVLLWYSITQFIVMRSNVHLYQFDFSVFRSFLVVINNIWERIQHNRTICSQLFQCLFLLHCFYLVFSCVCVCASNLISYYVHLLFVSLISARIYLFSLSDSTAYVYYDYVVVVLVLCQFSYLLLFFSRSFGRCEIEAKNYILKTNRFVSMRFTNFSFCLLEKPKHNFLRVNSYSVSLVANESLTRYR